MKAEMSFEMEWPPVARRLHSAFRHKKISPAMREDLVQETGLRLFEIWDRVDPDRDLWPLALTIALNILRDHLRSEARRNQMTAPEELIDHDTERVALARVELAEVNNALPLLTSAQRDALLAELGHDIGRPENSSALKMLRMRARRRLRALIDGASGAVGAIEVGLNRISKLGSSPLGEGLVPYLSVAAGVLCAAGLSGVTTPAHATVERGQHHVLESRSAERERTHALARTLVRSYRSMDADWFVNVTREELSNWLRGGPDLKSPRRLTEIDVGPQDEQRASRGPADTGQPMPTHRSEASVNSGGHRIKEKVSVEAAGHNAEALVKTESGGSHSCGRRSPSDCSPVSRARARARAELDEKGIELGVGG